MNTEMKREKEGNPLTTGAIESDNELDTYTISYNNRKLSTNVGTPRAGACLERRKDRCAREARPKNLINIHDIH